MSARFRTVHFLALVLIPGAAVFPSSAAGGGAAEIPGRSIELAGGPTNGAFLRRGGKVLVVYGDPLEKLSGADLVLFTHHRRDVAWAGRRLVEKGAPAVVPAEEAELFARPEEFWSKFRQGRFHDYGQQGTKVLAEPIPAARTVRGGDSFSWEGVPIRVLDTPGFTRGAVSYLIEVEGKVLAFTGDLVLAGGKIPDLYSLQDAIPEARIGGYHGYAARLGDLVSSLRKVAAESPAAIIPARGPVITDPKGEIEGLLKRIHAVYSNYLSIDALRWYFGDEHIQKKARRVLGPDAGIAWMEMAETVRKELPSWIIPISNSRLILSGDRSGFLVDCGGTAIIDELKKRRDAGTLGSLDHVFITHYHDDHTDRIPALVEAFGTTVHACRELVEVLEDPGAHRLPCLTRNPIHVSGVLREGASWRWKEFELASYHFPGQALEHGALLVKKDGGESVFFIGDSFTPTGIDDYCLQNRNFLHEGAGHFHCLDLIERAAPGALLINQHVDPAFRFSREQIGRMRETLRKRIELLEGLFPWDDPNFGLDEGWARFHPYACEVRPGAVARLEIRIMNHSPRERSFRARVRLPRGWPPELIPCGPVHVPPRQEGSLEVQIPAPAEAAPGLFIITADILWEDGELMEWTEAMITVYGPGSGREGVR